MRCGIPLKLPLNGEHKEAVPALTDAAEKDEKAAQIFARSACVLVKVEGTNGQR